MTKGQTIRTRYVDRLGNYALLEHGKNKSLAQKTFAEKAPVYETSQYGLTKDVAAATEWTRAAIAGRQKALARLATAVWQFP